MPDDFRVLDLQQSLGFFESKELACNDKIVLLFIKFKKDKVRGYVNVTYLSISPHDLWFL